MTNEQEQELEFLATDLEFFGPAVRAALVEIKDLRARAAVLFDAIKEHYNQKADDRCVFDDDKLYAAAGLPPVDRRVGDKFEMAKNCLRFIETRCEGGGWPTYRELEAKIHDLELQLDRQRKAGL